MAVEIIMELLSSYLVKKSDLGVHGNLFGGQLLYLLDMAAAAYAMQLCDTPRMVTVMIDKCSFEKPSKEGQLLKIFCRPDALGTAYRDWETDRKSTRLNSSHRL